MDWGGKKRKNSTWKKGTFNKPFMQRLWHTDNSTAVTDSTTWRFTSVTCLACDNSMAPEAPGETEIWKHQDSVWSDFVLLSLVSHQPQFVTCTNPFSFVHTVFPCAIWWISSEFAEFKKKKKQPKKPEKPNPVPLKCWLVSFPDSPQRIVTTPRKPQFSWSFLIHWPVFFTQRLWL